MIVDTDKIRLDVAVRSSTARKAGLGQYFTPSAIAQFMASLFRPTGFSTCRLLDAGAGIGSLSAAFLERWASGGFNFRRVEADAFEIDEGLLPTLTHTFEEYMRHLDITLTVREGDFVEAAVGSLGGNIFARALPRYTHAILNPPYKKIRSDSTYRATLRRVGIETVNLYSAFVALSLLLLVDNGQLVAIIPRSFCNGPYYRPFRDLLLNRAAIMHIHLFDSRNKAFRDDDVLQENVIIVLERGGRQGDVTVSTSTDEGFADLTTHTHRFDRIVLRDDPEHFIHVPTSPGKNAIELSPGVRYSLEDIGISVSTGPVVDFRSRAHLRAMPEPGAVPLLYPTHFSDRGTEWPKVGSKKPNAIHRNAETEKLLYPTGFYCVVRRFSPKEEKRRIMASVVHPDRFPRARMLGFENHLNVLHEHKHGLPETLARGLAAFLNMTAVDENFRRFNGHTQVNATDLKLIKYPSRDALMALGQWAMEHGDLTQEMIDDQLDNLTA